MMQKRFDRTPNRKKGQRGFWRGVGNGQMHDLQWYDVVPIMPVATENNRRVPGYYSHTDSWPTGHALRAPWPTGYASHDSTRLPFIRRFVLRPSRVLRLPISLRLVVLPGIHPFKPPPMEGAADTPRRLRDLASEIKRSQKGERGMSVRPSRANGNTLMSRADARSRRAASGPRVSGP